MFICGCTHCRATAELNTLFYIVTIINITFLCSKETSYTVDWEIFHAENNSRKKFVVLNFHDSFDHEIFLMVDGYNMAELPVLPCIRIESQVSLAVTLWLSGVVVDRAFTLGGVDMRARLFIDHCCVYVFICMLNFRSWSEQRNYFNSEILSMVMNAHTYTHVHTTHRVTSLPNGTLYLEDIIFFLQCISTQMWYMYTSTHSLYQQKVLEH